MSERSDSTDIEPEVATLAGSLNVLDAQLVEIAQRALATEEWVDHGIHSPAQWLAHRAGLSPHHAQEIVRVAERRASFPTIIEALDWGELPLDQVVTVVTRAPAYRHPSGERLDTNWVGLGWVHDNALKRRRDQARQTPTTTSPTVHRQRPPISSRSPIVADRAGGPTSPISTDERLAEWAHSDRDDGVAR